MPKVALTDFFLRSAQSDTQTDYWDTKTPGFGIRVGKNRKTFIAKVDNRRITIGSYPALSLQEARKKAFLTKGEDQKPAAKRTVNEAITLYKAAITSKKERTQQDYKRALDKYLAPKIGTKRLVKVVYEDVTKIAERLKPSEGAHVLAYARTFFRWCVKPPRRFIPYSPLEGVEVRLANKRKRILSDEEIQEVWSAAVDQGYPHGTIVRLILLTGQRRGEIANLRWPWINEKDQTITLPDWVCKNNKEHTFAYDGTVKAILETVPHRNTTDLLFPSRNAEDRPLSGWSKFKSEMADGVEGWTLHDLRRTFRSKHGEIGTPREIAERLINHVAAVTTDVERLYDHWTYLPQMKAAAEAYEAHIAALLAR